MRPEKLTFSGLRSYYGTAEVDFTDLGLFAIIGDTGSGKSTIIEALGLALYARPTWSGQIEGLVSDGASAWQVELTFVAGGSRWRVTRRRGKGASVDKLERLDGDHEKVDGKAPVTERVEQIIGLDHSQFTSSVVLPQGRFEKLLTAKETERTRLLTSILGLDDLEATQRVAKELIDRWAPFVQTWEGRRGDLGPDPAGDFERARVEAADAAARARRLTEAVQAHRELQPRAEQARRSHQQLGELIAQVHARPDGVEEQLTHVHTRWAAAAAEVAEAEKDLETVQAQLAELDQARVEHLDGYVDRDALVGALTDVRRVAEQLPDRQQRLVVARQQLDAARLEAPVGHVDPTIIAVHEQARSDVETAAATHAAAVAAQQHGASAWQTVLDARRRLAELEATAPQVDQDAELAQQLLVQARAGVEAAEQGVRDTATAVRSALVESAAAQAGAGCAPGDDCPVCARPLPDDFAAPDAHADVELAEAAQTEAESMADRARSQVQERSLVHDRAVSAVTALRADLDAARQEVQTAVAAAREAGVDADATTIDAALAAVTAAVDDAEQGLERTRSAAESAEGARTAAQAEVDRLVQEHGQKVARAEADAGAADRSVQDLIDELDRVASGAAPGGGDGDDGGDGVDPVERAAATLASLEESRRRLDALDEQLRGLSDTERDANQTLNRASVRAAEERDEAGRLVAGLQDHYSRISAACAAMPEAVPVSLPDPPSEVRTHDQLASECARIGGMLDQLDTATTAARAALDQLAGLRDGLDAQVSAVLEEAGCATSAELLHLEGAATAAADEAARNLERTRATAEKAALLDDRLAVAGPFVANLRVLNEALRNNKFIGHLVTARQRELLAEASQRLSEITGGRFGFGDDFKVINRHSGEQRRPDALSGGERFQAALALALALMEIASRGSRGRLEAVFIDEGFGSLDGAALEQALDRLRVVSGDGTTVALVSHLRAVAEHVNDVLHVTRDDATGSRVEKLDAEALERMLDDDVRSGLTA